MKKDNISFLQDLLDAPSPSGEEGAAIEVFKTHVEKFAKFDFVDKFQNCAFHVGSGPRRVMISGHIDSISMIVTKIANGGYLKFDNNGGIDKKVLPGSRVTVLGDSGPIVGIIGKAPVHVESEEERNEVIKIKDLFIDLGFETKKEVIDAGINVGTLIIHERGQSLLDFGPKGDLICSADLDDKIAVYIVSEVLRKINSVPKEVTLYGVACAGEEQGLRGAKVVARKINPDLSIDIDVTIDTDGDLGLVNQSEYCEVKVGCGPVIEFGGDKSRAISKELISLCKKEEIPYQLSATFPGGTNTAAIQECAEDCETAHIAIAVKNLHTPQEIASWNDIEWCIDLLVKYLGKDEG